MVRTLETMATIVVASLLLRWSLGSNPACGYCVVLAVSMKKWVLANVTLRAGEGWEWSVKKVLHSGD